MRAGPSTESVVLGVVCGLVCLLSRGFCLSRDSCSNANSARGFSSLMDKGAQEHYWGHAKGSPALCTDVMRLNCGDVGLTDIERWQDVFSFSLIVGEGCPVSEGCGFSILRAWSWTLSARGSIVGCGDGPVSSAANNLHVGQAIPDFCAHRSITPRLRCPGLRRGPGHYFRIRAVSGFPTIVSTSQASLPFCKDRFADKLGRDVMNV